MSVAQSQDGKCKIITLFFYDHALKDTDNHPGRAIVDRFFSVFDPGIIPWRES